MGAAEKLRALDGKFEGLRVGDTPPPVIEVLFWPQIVAVVEAAERAVDQFDTPERYIGTPMADLRAALTALDEALEC